MAGRPRGDRAERIAATAARLFRERGFHATSIDDIGRAEGISGPAIYRHFRSKDELLAAVARRGVRHVADHLARAGENGDGGDRRAHLAATIRAGGQAVIEQLDAIVVYLRDGRHLTSEQRRPILQEARANDQRLIAAVQAARPELSRHHVGFMLQSLAGMYLSRAHFHPRVTNEQLVDIWAAMGTAALLGAPDAEVERSHDAPAAQRFRPSRRELILAEATTLFHELGYAGVGIDDIGTAAGIAGPAVYRHFENKEEVLAATMTRAGEQLAASAVTALAAATPELALDRLIISYTDIAIEHADTIAVYLREVDSLSASRRRAVRRGQRSYLDAWQAVVAELAPDRPADHVRAAVHAAVGLINGYADGRVRPPEDVAATILTGMVRSALDAYTANLAWSPDPAALRRVR